jgi:hypothetical protein
VAPDPISLADEIEDGETGYLLERALDEERAVCSDVRLAAGRVAQICVFIPNRAHLHEFVEAV